MSGALGQKCKPAVNEQMTAGVGFQLQFTLENIEESLCRRWPQHAATAELRRHLCEPRAQLRSSVNYELHALRTRQRSANESVGRLQQMIGFEAASCCSQIMQL